MDRIEPNFVYTLTLIVSRLGLYSVKFHKIATEVRPLIDVRIPLPLNILRTNGQNSTKFCIHINIDKILVGIVKHHFSQICNRVMALD